MSRQSSSLPDIDQRAQRLVPRYVYLVTRVSGTTSESVGHVPVCLVNAGCQRARRHTGRTFVRAPPKGACQPRGSRPLGERKSDE